MDFIGQERLYGIPVCQILFHMVNFLVILVICTALNVISSGKTGLMCSTACAGSEILETGRLPTWRVWTGINKAACLADSWAVVPPSLIRSAGGKRRGLPRLIRGAVL